jgi:hypothetical protein
MQVPSNGDGGGKIEQKCSRAVSRGLQGVSRWLPIRYRITEGSTHGLYSLNAKGAGLRGFSEIGLRSPRVAPFDGSQFFGVNFGEHKLDLS